MGDPDANLEWSSQIEDILATEGERCRGLAWLHLRAEMTMSKYNTYVQVPVIIMSTLAGTASVGSSSLFPGNSGIASTVIGLVSIGVGMLNTLGGFFAFAKRSEAHRIAHLSYSKLYSQIGIELSLPRCERISAESMLSKVRDTMERMAETTPNCPSYIIDQFNSAFKDEKTIAKPIEVNGLHRINIYREEWHVKTPKLELPKSASLQTTAPPTPKTSSGGRTPNNLQTSSSARPLTLSASDNSHI